MAGDLNRLIAKMKRYERTFEGIADRYVDEVGREAEKFVKGKIDDGFAERRDPYGKKWPLPKDGHRPAMERTGDLRRGYSVRLQRGGEGKFSVAVSNDQEYSAYLQRGTPHMAPRKQVPDRGLPASWERGLGDIARRVYDRLLRKGR